MTVKELINKLLDMPMDADVITKQIHSDGEFIIERGLDIQKMELNNSINVVYIWSGDN